MNRKQISFLVLIAGPILGAVPQLSQAIPPSPGEGSIGAADQLIQTVYSGPLRVAGNPDGVRKPLGDQYDGSRALPGDQYDVIRRLPGDQYDGSRRLPGDQYDGQPTIRR